MKPLQISVLWPPRRRHNFGCSNKAEWNQHMTSLTLLSWIFLNRQSFTVILIALGCPSIPSKRTGLVWWRGVCMNEDFYETSKINKQVCIPAYGFFLFSQHQIRRLNLPLIQLHSPDPKCPTEVSRSLVAAFNRLSSDTLKSKATEISVIKMFPS